MVKAMDMIRAAPKYLGVPYSKLDCQAFVEKCMKDAGISVNLPGSNAWYRKMTWVGTPDECKKKFGEIPHGAFLYILKPSGGEPEKYKPDGIGNASHIGLYTGMSGAEMCDIAVGDGIGDADRYNHGNGAIHSSSSRGCVCTSTFAGKAINGGWNCVGLWDRISYGKEADEILTGKGTPGNSSNEGSEMMTATVYAPSGGTVNLRQKPTTNSALISRIPVGTQVTVESESGDWAYIHCGNQSGYMMTKYLIPGEVVPGENSGDGSVIVVSRDWMETLYQQIGDLLGVKG